jgi:GT2 family glycosyltransferase
MAINMRYKTGQDLTSIAIILLTYNGLKYTKKCIKNLIDYTDNFNLIIVDNNSTDGTVEYLKSISDQHSNITLELLDKNIGVIKGRNLGYRISIESNTGIQYVMFIDNDQFVSESWQDVYLNIMREGFDIVGSEAWKMDRRTMFPKCRCTSLGEEFSYVGAGGMMIKHDVIKNIGMFDERFSPMYFEDPSFCFDAFKEGYSIIWRPFFIDHMQHNLLKKEGEDRRKEYFFNSHKKFVEKYINLYLPTFKNPPKSLRIKYACTK